MRYRSKRTARSRVRRGSDPAPGIEPHYTLIRGGTTGEAHFRGLLTRTSSRGEAFHSRMNGAVPVMEKAVETVINLAVVWRKTRDDSESQIDLCQVFDYIRGAGTE